MTGALAAGFPDGQKAAVVILACPGLDHAHRGFETFARECFEEMRKSPELSIELAKGTGDRRLGEVVIPTLTRDGFLARHVGKLASREPFVVEHVAFALAFLPTLARRRPNVVYFSEWHVGRILGVWRRVSRQKFALVFCNGALVSEGYGHLDLVQQLVPGGIEYSVERGCSKEDQTLLPLGVAMESFRPPSQEERANLRRTLGLPVDRRIVLSVGAINSQKRMSYLVDEIASMPQPRPFLLLVGEQEIETPAIRERAQKRLGHENHLIRTVPLEAMADHYRASDVFVLASHWESFGRVLVEAQSHGLPCLAHDYPVMRWVLGDEGHVEDLREPGRVAAWLSALGEAEFSIESRECRRRSSHERFSWAVLAPRYVEMLSEAARGSIVSQCSPRVRCRRHCSSVFRNAMTRMSLHVSR